MMIYDLHSLLSLRIKFEEFFPHLKMNLQIYRIKILRTFLYNLEFIYNFVFKKINNNDFFPVFLIKGFS